MTTLDQTLLLVPERAQPDALFGFHIPGLGVVLSFLILLVTGVIAANFFGARLILIWEAVLGRIPFVKSIYSAVKQVSDTLLSDKGNAFRKALLVEYPHEGCWTIAFLTGTPDRGRRAIPAGRARQRLRADDAQSDRRAIFLMVPRSRVRELDMTVDEALKYIISMGVVAPARRRAPRRVDRRSRARRAGVAAKLTGPACRGAAIGRAHGVPTPPTRGPRAPPERRLHRERSDQSIAGART